MQYVTSVISYSLQFYSKFNIAQYERICVNNDAQRQ